MKTKTMKKVLIALDYGPTAQEVAEVGFSLAKSMEAEVTLLHVILEPVNYSSPEFSPILGFTGFHETTPMQLNNEEALKSASQDFLDRIKQHLGDETIQTLLKGGDTAEAILKAAKNLHVDVIVIGSHSRRWLEEILMGSVTEKVLHNTSVPLFIIPTKKHK